MEANIIKLGNKQVINQIHWGLKVKDRIEKGRKIVAVIMRRVVQIIVDQIKEINFNQMIVEKKEIRPLLTMTKLNH